MTSASWLWNLSGSANDRRSRAARLYSQPLTSEGRTLAQGALAWLWTRSRQTLPIPGFKTIAQVEENCAALHRGPLAAEQMREIDGLLER
jgi:aryl-alcohol dehydrogenase-like predicted oxidoreductase